MIHSIQSGIRSLVLLFCLLFTAGRMDASCTYNLSATETATLPSSSVALNNLSVCTTYNLTYVLVNSGSPGAVNDNLTISLPWGITATALSSYSSSSGTPTVSFSNAGATPKLTVSGWDAGATLTVTLTVQTPSCGPVTASPSLTSISGTSACNVFPITTPLTITVPALSVTNTASNNFLDKNKGDVDEIVFQIQNSSNNGASISQINVSYTSDPNTTFYGNYYISNSASKQPGNNMYTYVPATASAGIYIPSTGTPSFVMDQSIFGYFFSGTTALADGNSLYLHIPYKVTGCLSPNTTGGKYIFSWGCGSTQCKSDTSKTFVNVVLGDPQMKVTSFELNPEASFCPAASGASYQFGFHYTNNGVTVSGAPVGNAMATGLKINLFSTTSMGTIDATNLMFTDGIHAPVAIPTNIITSIPSSGMGYTTYEINFGALTVAQAGSWDPFGTNSLADLNSDGFVDDLAEGGSLVIEGNFIYNQTSCPFDGTCSGYSNYFTPATSPKYQNQCQTIPATDVRVEFYPWENAAYYLYQVSRASSSMTAPSDVIAGTPFQVNLCPVYYELWGPVGYDFKCPNGYHDIHIPLPAGFHLDPTGLTHDASGAGYNLSPITPTTGGCNGGPPVTIIPDAIETPADITNCIPGYIDIKLGRIQFGNCSNVYNETYLLPCMNVPMVENCDGGHCGTNFGPDVLSYTLEYICDPGCATCVSDLACANTETYHHCNGRCDSYFSTDNPVSFKRINLGALNPPTYYGCSTNLPVPVTATTSPDINVSAAYPGDLIEVKATGSFMGTPSATMNVNTGASYDSIYLQIQYDQLPAGKAYSDNMFDFDKTHGMVLIHTSATTTYTVNASSMTSSFSTVAGVNYLNLTFRAGLGQITSSIYTYVLEADLFLILKASPVIPGTTTFFAPGFFPLVNLRMQYGGIEKPVYPSPTGIQDGSCDSYGAPFTIEQPSDAESYDFDSQNSCDLYYTYFELESSSAKWGTYTDDFPNEYRPYAGLDPVLSINIPRGYAFVAANYRTIRTPIGTAPNNFDSPGSYQWAYFPVTLPSSNPPVGNTSTGIQVFFNGIDGQGACWPGLDDKNATWRPIGGIQLILQPLCTALPTDHFQFSGSYTEGLQQSNPLYQRTTSFIGNVGPAIHHVNPLLSLNPPAATVNAYGNAVSFNFQYCNTGTINANNAWIAFENNPAFNALDLNTATVQTVPGGVTLTPYVYMVGGHPALLVNVGSLPVSSCVSLELTATVNGNGCVSGSSSVLDFVSVKYGNECTGTIQSPDPSCEIGTTLFSFERYPSSLELLAGTNPYPTTPVDLCDGILNYNFIINSADIGTISNPTFWMDLPPGITLQSASFILGCTGTLHTYTSTTVNGNNYGPTGTKPGWDLNTDLNLNGLTGTITAPNNQICVSLALKTNCSYNATDILSFYAGGLSECGQNLVTQPLQNQPPINNATPSDNLNVQVHMTTTDGHAQLDCSNTGTVTVTITNNGSTNTHNDAVTVSIPSSPVVTSNYGTAVAAANTLTWNIPAGTLPASGTQTFTFDMSLNGTLSCQHNIGINAVISYNQNVSCTASGGSCAVAYSSAPVGIIIDACCQCNMIASTTTSNVLCNGGNSGTATVNITGGVTPLTYLWSNGQSTATATGLTAGTYSVTVTDANGCTTTSMVTITQPPAITTSVTTTNVSCNGGTNGSATVTTGGGTGAYSYNWSPVGGNTATASNLTAGTYSVTVSDVNGCSVTTTVTITQPDPFSQTHTIVPSCDKTPNGSITLNIAGGTPNYTYSWSNGATTSSISNLFPGTYTVTVTDAHGCSGTGHLTVGVAPGTVIQISASPYPQLCAGTPVMLCASGAVTGYTWNIGQSGSCITVNPSAPTTYQVQGIDDNGCAYIRQITITPPTPVTVTAIPTNPLCYGGNGSASAAAMGGTGTYSYSWSPSGGNAATAVNLAPGIYTVYATDANNCTASAPVTINQPAPLTVQIQSVTNVLCAYAPIGSASATVSGGTGSYSYSWSPTGGNSLTANHLSGGTYTLFATDANGCTGSAVATITSPLPLVVNVTPAPSCRGLCNGSVTTVVNGGHPSYTYLWSNGHTTASINGLCANTYQVTVTDGNNCIATATATVTTVSPPVVTVSPTSATVCPNTATTLCPSSASGTLTYSWTPLVTSTGAGNCVSVSPATTTTYTVVGSNGTCSSRPATATITVKPAMPVCHILPQTICAGSTVTLNGSCGSGGLFFWTPTTDMNPSSGFGATVTVTPTATTTYTVTANSFFPGAVCPSSYTATVNVNPGPTVTASAAPSAVCLGSSTVLTASTSSPGSYSYSWSGGLGSGNSVSVTPAMSTNYTVTVQNTVTGCSATVIVPVTVNPVPEICVSDVGVCPGRPVHLNAHCTPAPAHETYTWTSSSGTVLSTGPVLAVAPTTTTTYTITANLGSCSISQPVTVNMFSASLFTVTGPPPPFVVCGSTYTYTVTPTVSIPSLSYSWTSVNPSANGNGASATVTVLPPSTTITWNIVDLNGDCKTAVTEHIVCRRVKEESSSVDSLPTSPAGPSVLVYPNPADAGLNIQISSDKDEEPNLCLYNNMGQLIHCEMLKNGLSVLPTSEYPVGIYYYYITDKKGNLLKADKVMITH